MHNIYYLFFALVITFNLNTTYSKEIKNVIYFDYRNEALVTLKLGVDSLATEYYDPILGEQNIPPLPPPDAVIPVFEILDTNLNEMKYSQNEYKSMETGIFSKKYKVRLLGNAQEDFKLSVRGLQNGIDSLIIKDAFNGNLFRWVVSKNEPKDTTMLRFYSQFEIEVFYNADNATGVESIEELEDKHLVNNYYLSSKILVNSSNISLLDNDIKVLNVFDILGNEIKFNEILEFNSYNENNILFIYIEYKNKRHFIKKIL